MVIDKQQAADTLFGNIKRQKTAPVEHTPIPQSISIKSHIEHSAMDELYKAKWERLDRVTVLFTASQKEGLDRLSKRIMKSRPKKSANEETRERITANTLMRALSDILLEAESFAQIPIINTEEDVKNWMRALLKSKD